jgi:hypothetical protein
MSKFVKWSPIFNPDGLRPKVTDEYLGFVKMNENGLYMGGCYMYAYDTSGSIVSETPTHLDSRVIYIGAAGSTKHRGIHHRTGDFAGSITNGHNQRKPYPNGMIFRDKFGVENRANLYVAYMPMGYGIKQEVHDMEIALINEYRNHFGQLGACHGGWAETPTLDSVKMMIPNLDRDDSLELMKMMIPNLDRDGLLELRDLFNS